MADDTNWGEMTLKERVELVKHLYLNERKSMNIIGKSVGRSSGAIWHLMNKHGIPRRSRSEGNTLACELREQEIAPSPDLSYVIGVVKGDGWAYHLHRHYRIGLNAKSPRFVRKFSEYLAKVLGREKPYAVYQRKDGLYVTEGNSKPLYHFLKNDGWRGVTGKYPIEFLVGFFDSEGCVTYRGGSISIEFYCSDFDLLSYVVRTLEKQGIRASIRKKSDAGQKSVIQGREVTTKKPSYRIWFGGRRARRFLNAILPLHPIKILDKQTIR